MVITWKHKVAGIIAAIMLVFGSVLAVDAAAAPPAQAKIVDHDAWITNSKSSDSRLLVCYDWGVSSCAKGSQTQVLAKGQMTKCPHKGKQDCDGYRIGPGYAIRITCEDHPHTIYGEGWHKITGTFLKPNKCTIITIHL